MQEAIVTVIVAVAALVVARRYGPASLRALLNRAWPGRRGAALNKSTCGGCDGCAPTSTAAQATISVAALKKTIRAKV